MVSTLDVPDPGPLVTGGGAYGLCSVEAVEAVALSCVVVGTELEAALTMEGRVICDGLPCKVLRKDDACPPVPGVVPPVPVPAEVPGKTKLSKSRGMTLKRRSVSRSKLTLSSSESLGRTELPLESNGEKVKQE